MRKGFGLFEIVIAIALLAIAAGGGFYFKAVQDENITAKDGNAAEQQAEQAAEQFASTTAAEQAALNAVISASTTISASATTTTGH